MERFALYSPMRNWLVSDLPASPFVSIALGDHVTQEGNRMLSAHLMTDSEIDLAIDDLIQQLNKLRGKAKKELQLRKESMVRMIRERSERGDA